MQIYSNGIKTEQH